MGRHIRQTTHLLTGVHNSMGIFNISLYTMFIIHRGFGFVTFEDPLSIEKVLSEPSHELDGKRVIMILINK